MIRVHPDQLGAGSANMCFFPDGVEAVCVDMHVAYHATSSCLLRVIKDALGRFSAHGRGIYQAR